MKFEYTTYIENSPIIKEYLLLIGCTERPKITEQYYKKGDLLISGGNEVKGKYLVRWKDGYFNEERIITKQIKNVGIDCLANIELFKAVSSINKYSSQFQYFTHEGKMIDEVCDCQSHIDMWGDFDRELGEEYPEKATLEELKIYFKKD